METLVAIRGGKIKTTVGNWDKPDRSHLQAAEQTRITEEYESAPGAADVAFVVVTDPNQAAVEARHLEPEWEWNSGKEIGTEPADIKAEREALEAALAEEEAAKTDAEAMLADLNLIAAGTFIGTTEEAQRIIARAVKFIVLQGVRDTGSVPSLIGP